MLMLIQVRNWLPRNPFSPAVHYKMCKMGIFKRLFCLAIIVLLNNSYVKTYSSPSEILIESIRFAKNITISKMIKYANAFNMDKHLNAYSVNSK